MMIRDLIYVRDFPAVVQAADVRSMRDAALQLRAFDVPSALDAPPVPQLIDEAARDFIGGYLGFDERARHALETSIASLGANRGGAYFLNGVFGSGKSHLLGLLALLCDGIGHDVLRSTHAGASAPLRAFKPRLVVHFSLDEYAAARHALEDIFWRELRNEWRRHDFDLAELPASDSTHSNASSSNASSSNASRSETFSILEDALSARGLHGLVVFIDELSLFLSGREHKSLQNDAAFLQFLGQRARRSSAAANNASVPHMSTHACPLWIFAALQKTVEDIGDLDSYALSQIRDRFTTLSLSLAHLPSLIERRLIVRRDDRALHRLCDETFDALLAALPRLDFGREEWERLYPFHPATIALLEQVVARYGSRTRSAALFCAQAVKAEDDASNRVSVAALFSYIEPELGAHPDLRPLATVWKNWRDGESERALATDENTRLDALMQALLLWKIAGSAPSVAQLVHALSLDARLPADGNYEYGRILLEKMRLFGPIAVERREGAFADRYAIDLGTRIGEMTRRFTANALHTLPPRDGRIARHARVCCRDESMPFAALQDAASTPLSWRNSARNIRIEILDAPPDAATLANRLAALSSLGAPDDIALFIVPPFSLRFAEQTPHMSTHVGREEQTDGGKDDGETSFDEAEAEADEMEDEFAGESAQEFAHRQWREAMRAAWLAAQNAARSDSSDSVDAASRHMSTHAPPNDASEGMASHDDFSTDVSADGIDARWRGAVLWWLPREASHDEWQQARETTAQHLLKSDPQLADNRRGRSVLEYLRQGEAGREAALGRIAARLLFEGQIATGAGLSVDAADLAGRESWTATLEALAEFALPQVFPRFSPVAPRLRVLTGANSDALCLDILRRPVASPFFTVSLSRVARAVGEPLGVARENNGRWKIAAPRDDLMQEVLHLVGQGALLAAIEALLEKGEWGLPPEQSRIVLCALLRSGDLAAFDTRGVMLSPSAIGLPLRRAVHALRPGRLPDESTWLRLRDLLVLLMPRETLQSPSFSEQERVVALLFAWREEAASQTELAQARLHQWRRLAASPSRWPRIDAAWESIGALLHALKEQGATGETLQRAARLESETLSPALQTWRETLEKLEARHAALIESHALLSHADLVAPTEMQSARAALLARFEIGEDVLDDENLPADAARWLHEYSARYQEWHGAQNAAPRFAAYRRLLASDEMRVLQRLEMLQSRSWPQGSQARASIGEELARECARDGQLRGEVVCPACRLRFNARLTLRDLREIESLLANGIASFHAALQEPPAHEYLARFPQNAVLLEWSDSPPDNDSSDNEAAALLPLLNDETLQMLDEAFRPRRRVARSWTALREETANCRTKREWRHAFLQWLDGDDAIGDEDEIALND